MIATVAASHISKIAEKLLHAIGELSYASGMVSKPVAVLTQKLGDASSCLVHFAFLFASCSEINRAQAQASVCGMQHAACHHVQSFSVHRPGHVQQTVPAEIQDEYCVNYTQ